MGAAEKKYNSKMTLLSIYTERLGGFTSSGKQVLARGAAINGRFRFSLSVFFFSLQATMGRAGGEKERDSQGRRSRGGEGRKDGSHDVEGEMRREASWRLRLRGVAEVMVSRSGRERRKRKDVNRWGRKKEMR